MTKKEDDWMIEQIFIPYNRDAAIIQSEKNGRIDWSVALRTGRINQIMKGEALHDQSQKNNA